MSFPINKINSVKIIPLIVIWITLSVLFYTGVLSMNLPGHIEVCLIVAFAVVLLGVHLFSIIKKTSQQYL